MIQVGTTVEISREPPYPEYGIHIGDIGVVTYIAKTGKYSVRIDGKKNPHHDADRKYGENGDFWIPRECLKEYKFKQGDRVKIVSKTSKYKGCLATIGATHIGVNNYIGLYVDGYEHFYRPAESEYDCNKYLKLAQTSIQLIKQESEERKMKLTGYNKVAVIKMSGVNYYFALYDDTIEVGDSVLVSGACEKVIVVDEILTLEEAKSRFNNTITAEVKCKVDLSAYNQRVENRIKAAELLKEMDKKIKEMDEMNKYAVYAERNPELAKMLEEYNSLT